MRATHTAHGFWPGVAALLAMVLATLVILGSAGCDASTPASVFSPSSMVYRSAPHRLPSSP